MGAKAMPQPWTEERNGIAERLTETRSRHTGIRRPDTGDRESRIGEPYPSWAMRVLPRPWTLSRISAMAAGVMPGMRLAWPRVSGLTASSLP